MFTVTFGKYVFDKQFKNKCEKNVRFVVER